MKIPLTVVIIALLASRLTGCVSAPSHEGPSLPHFDGERFYNTEPMDKDSGDMFRLGWGALMEAENWPEWVEVTPATVAHERVTNGMSVTFINHASFLLQVDGLNILTDPVYADRASPYEWAGPQRVHEPGIKLEDLPPIDIILISHNHYDHLDEDTLRYLATHQDKQPLVLAGLGNGLLFAELGLENYRDLDWDEAYNSGGVEFIFSECRHRSGRGVTDQMETLWGAFVIRSSAGPVYFAGDSGYGAHFKNTGDRYGPFTLALLPIGAYEPRWFMRDVHVDPAEAVQAHIDLRSESSIGMHFGTFQLTYEARDQPLIDLKTALENRNIGDDVFTVLEVGESRRIR